MMASSSMNTRTYVREHEKIKRAFSISYHIISSRGTIYRVCVSSFGHHKYRLCIIRPRAKECLCCAAGDIVYFLVREAHAATHNIFRWAVTVRTTNTPQKNNVGGRPDERRGCNDAACNSWSRD